MIEQRKMEAYLHDKYGKDFSVTNVRREGAAIGAKGSMFGDAMPKDGSSDKFLVRETGNGYMDLYPNVIWAKDIVNELKPVVGGQGQLSAEVIIDNVEKLMIPTSSIPTWSQAVNDYRSYMSVIIGIRKERESIDFKSVLDDSYSVLEKARGYQLNRLGVNYIVYSQKADESLKCLYYDGRADYIRVNSAQELDKYCKIYKGRI